MCGTGAGEILEHKCEMANGYGCFDCMRGCHTKYYNNHLGHAVDWADMEVSTDIVLSRRLSGYDCVCTYEPILS